MNDILELFKIAGRIDLDGVDKANSDLDKLDNKGKSTAGKIGSFAKKIGKGAMIVGTATTAVGTAAFAMTQKVTDSFDNIAKTSHKLGITTDAYQVLDYWAGQNGVSTASMERAVGRLNQRMGLAAAGNEKYTDALTALGVSMDDVKKGTISTEDALKQAIGTLMKMENSQEKSALAAELFGTKLARDLMPALDEGSLSIEDATKAAEELGFVIDNDTLSAAEHFNDTWDNLTRSFGAFNRKLLAQLMPVFQSMMDWILKHLPTIQKVFTFVFNAASKVISVAVSWIQKLISILISWYKENESVVKGIWSAIKTYLGLVIDYWQTVFTKAKEIIEEVFNFIVPIISNAVEWIMNFWNGNGNQLLDSFMNVFNSIKDVVMTVFEALKTIVSQVLEWVAPFIQEKLQVLLKFWQENGAQIMEAVSNVFNFIKSVIDFIMPAVLFIVEMVWNNIKGVINGALNFIMGIIKVFSSLFTGDWEGLWEGIKQMLKGAVEFIWNFIQLSFIGKGLKMITNFSKLAVNAFRNMGTGVANIFRNLGTNATNLVSNLVSRVLGFFRNLGSGAVNSVTNMFTRVTNVFKNMLSFINNLGKSFLNAGKGLINNLVKGITGSIGKAVDAVKGVVGKIRNFLPFSPAKEGPLSDLDKLDFEGPIGDSIERGENTLKKKMADMLGNVHPTANVNIGGRLAVSSSTSNNESNDTNIVMVELMKELIKAVKEGKNLILDGEVLARFTDNSMANSYDLEAFMRGER